MRLDVPREIQRWLEASGGLSEALMTELCLANHGYSVHLVFRVVVDRQGRVLDNPMEVVVDLDGVEKLILVGGLTDAMLAHPEEIGWGLSEVAQVRVWSTQDEVHCEVCWEGERRVEVVCRCATLSVPTTAVAGELG